MEFQSSLQKLQRSPCWHYSYESWAMHKTPRVVLNLNPRSLAVGKRNRGRMAGLYRRLGSPAARSGLGETKKRLRRTQRWSFWGSGWSDWGFPAARCGGGLGSSPATVLRRRIGVGEVPGRCAILVWC